MKCTEARSKMNAAIDREINVDTEQQELQTHCDDCVNCRHELQNLTGLHNRMRDFAGAITVPVGMQERLRIRLQQDETGLAGTTSNVVGIFSGPAKPLALFAAVAAAVAVFWLVPFFQPRAEIAPQIAVNRANQPAAPVSTQARAADLIANFSKSAVQNEQDVQKLARAAGFAVNMPQLDGFKLASSEVCDLSGKRFVRLTYNGSLAGKAGSLVCYVCPTGAFDAAGLDTHVIGGRKVCCGRMQAVSLVYLPAKAKGNDMVLVSQAPKSALMDLALKS
jgi:hypothetical protein